MSDTPAAPDTEPKQPPQQTQTVELWPGMVAEVMTPENRLIYVGKIEKIQNGGVYIREINEDTLPMVLVNKPVKVRFYRGADHVVLHGKVCGSTMTMWKIDRLVSTFAREQRAFFRQSISVDIRARCGQRPKRGRHPEVLFPCQVLDVSAGGMLISCAEVFVEGEHLIVAEVPLVADAPTFTFSCQIRRASEWQKGVSRYGCQFDALSARDQDRLLHAIFTIQREEIRKRKSQNR